MLDGSDAEVNDVAKVLVSKRLFWLLLVAVPVVAIPGCAMGIASAMAVFAFHHWWQKLLFLICALVGLCLPFFVPRCLVWIHKGSAKRIVEELVNMERAALAQCLDALPQPSYFNVASGPFGGAIAVDPVSKKLALVFGQMQAGYPAKTRTIVLNRGELRRWAAEQPGIVTFGLIGSGHSSTDMLRAHEHDRVQRVHQAHGTGLRLFTENLNATEVFLNFNYDVAKSWVVLLEKFSDDRLESSNTPTEFPKS